jgi:hypothetical protein
VKQYSFNADLRSVFQRLAATKPASTTPVSGSDAASRAKLIAFQPRALEPRVEIAHVALRRSRHETRDAAT